MSSPYSLLSSASQVPITNQSISANTATTPSIQSTTSNKLLPKILCGKLHRDNKSAADWSWQNLFAYGCYSHVAIVDPAYLHVVQTLDEHRHNVNVVRWSRDIHQSSQHSSVRLASADTGGTILIWDVLEASVIQSIGDLKTTVKDIQWLPNDPSLILVLTSNGVSLWNIQNAQRIWRRDIEHSISLQLDPLVENRVLISTINGSVYSFELNITNNNINNNSSNSINSPPIPFSLNSNNTNISNYDNIISNPPVLEYVHRAIPLKSGVATSTSGSGMSSGSNTLSSSTSGGSNIGGTGGNTNTSSGNTGGNTSATGSSSASSGTSLPGNTAHIVVPKSIELHQMVCSPISRNIVYYLFQREMVVYDISSNQIFGSVHLERNKSNFQSILLCRENPYLMFSLHEDGSITSWNRRVDTHNTHNYEQLCISDLSHFHKKSKKKGLQLYSITHHPFNEQTILSIAGDGIIWKWDFTSEILSGSQLQFSPRLETLSLKPLNGVVKLGVSGTSDGVSNPISSMSVYPFANRANMSLIVVGTTHGTVQLLNATTLRVQKEIFIWQQPVYGLKWLSPGRVICYSYEEIDGGKHFHNRLAMVDLRSGRVKEFRLVATNETTPIRGLRLSFSRKFLVILLKERPFELWETKRFTCLRSFKQYPLVSGLEWVPPRDDSETSLSPDTSRYESREQFIFFNAENSVSIKCCTIEGNSVTMVDITIEGNTLANVMGGNAPHMAHALKRDLMVAGDAAGNIHIWSSERKRLISNLSTHKSSIKKIRFSPSPNSSEIMVLFSSGELAIFDLSTGGSKTATGSYLSERDIKAIDIEWLTDTNPIVVSADHSIRILDTTLCLTNSRVNNVIGGSSTNNSIFEGFIYSPLLLSPFCAMQLRHLLHGCRLQSGNGQDIDLGKSQASSMLLLDQLEKNTRLLSLIDDRLIGLLSSSTVAECSLVIAQFFGDYQQIKFWRLVSHILETIDKSLYTSGQTFYNQEILSYFDTLPSIPPVPTRNETSSTITNTTSTSPSVATSTTPSNNTSSTTNISTTGPSQPISTVFSNNQTNNTTPLSTSPMSTPTKSTPPPAEPPTSLSKKQSIASFFGGFAQGLASKANITKDQPKPTPTVVPPPVTTITSTNQPQSNTTTNTLNSNQSINQSQSINSLNTGNPNPLSTSQVFTSVASQLQQSQQLFVDIDTTLTQSSDNNSPMNSSLADSGANLEPLQQHQQRSLPIYYDMLCDHSTYRLSTLERLDLQERKKHDSELSKSLIENNILTGRAPRAVSLLLDTTPDHPDFYNKAVKASMIAASISQECYHSTMKLLADNLVAVGKIDEGVQFLCLIDKVLEACKYLQGAQRWNEAASLAKHSLGDDEIKVVFRQWAIHLALHEKNYQKAIELFLSLGDFYSVVQILYVIGKFDVASHLIEACYESGVLLDFTTLSSLPSVNNNANLAPLVDLTPTKYNNNNSNNNINSKEQLQQQQESVFSPIPNLTNEFTLQQLIQIIFKEHGNLLHQLSNFHSDHYWQKAGTNKPRLLTSSNNNIITNFDSLI